MQRCQGLRPLRWYEWLNSSRGQLVATIRCYFAIQIAAYALPFSQSIRPRRPKTKLARPRWYWIAHRASWL